MRAHLLISALLLAAPLSSARAAEPKPSTPPPKTRVLELAIDGMVTDNCPVLVKTAVGKLPGVTRVDADAKGKTATVEYQEGKLKPSDVVRAIKDGTGFDASPVHRVHLKVKGMVSDNCPVLARKALEPVAGVREVRASLADKSVDVEYVEGKVTPAAMVTLLKDKAGFDAVVVRNER